MMIGPDPMTRTLLTGVALTYCVSIARGLALRSRSSARNSSKRYPLSNGPGDASGWNCTEMTGRVRVRQPLDAAVIEIDQRDFPLVAVWQRIFVNAEAMILGGDRHLAGPLDRAPDGCRRDDRI